MKTNISTLPINWAHRWGSLRTIAERCNAICRIGALAALLLLAAAPNASAAGGPLVIWGSNYLGATNGTPVGTFSAVSAGLRHNVAIKPDGTLVSWGNDEDGQVSGTPTTGTFSAVSAGITFSVAIRTDGTLVSWGSDLEGQLSYMPTTGTFSAVAAGPTHGVAIRTDGTLASWGDDFLNLVSDTPDGTFSAVAAGSGFSVAISTDGKLFAWGNDWYGQVSGTPTTGTFSAVAAGARHIVAITTDGTLVSWGQDNDDVVSDTPTTGTFSAVDAGGYHSVAIRTDGTLVSWGYNGDGLVMNTPDGTFSAVSAGFYHSVAIKIPGANQPPVALCQNMTVFADASCSAIASIDAGSTDPDAGDSISLSQSPASPYPLGQTVVTLTVTDSNGASSSCQATVTVVDNTPPVIGSCPANKTVNATSPAGAVPTFVKPTATDNCSVVGVSCSPASGSALPIGLTTVTCTATDGSGNHSDCSFTVTVKDARGQIGDLIAKVNQLPGVASATKNALVVKLNAAQAALKINNTATACASLQDFINLCLAQKTKKLIPATAAADLITDATRIRAVIGCP